MTLADQLNRIANEIFEAEYARVIERVRAAIGGEKGAPTVPARAPARKKRISHVSTVASMPETFSSKEYASVTGLPPIRVASSMHYMLRIRLIERISRGQWRKL